MRPRWQPTPPTQPPVHVDWAAVGIQRWYSLDYLAIRHDPKGDGGLGQDVAYRNQTLDVMCVFYGPHASGIANAFMDGLGVPQNWEMLNKQGIRLKSCEEITNTSELINMQWVPRCDVMLTVQRQVTRRYQVRTILRAPFKILFGSKSS